jgi:hypothetical protein
MNLDFPPHILSLKELHDATYGAEDKAYNESLTNYNIPRFNLTPIATHTTSFYSPPNGGKFSHTLRIPEYTNNVPGTGYANFKITPFPAISDIRLEAGNAIIDRRWLYKFLNRDIEFYEMSNGRALPAMRYQDYVIYFETNSECEVKISYDIVTHINPDENIFNQSLVYGEQCIDRLPVTNKFSNIRIPFNHPIVEIYAFLPPNTVDARILINDKDHNLILTKKGNFHHIWFGDETSINFSRIDNPTLQLTLMNDVKCTVNIVAIHKNFMSRLNGMSGLAYLN